MTLSVTLEQLKNDKKLLFDFVEFFLGFRLYDYQLRFIDACLNNTRVNGLWCRQSGKSQSLAVYIVLVSILSKKDIIISAPTDTQAKLIYEKVVDLVYSSKELASFITSSIQEKTTFTTGSTVKMITVGPTGTTKRGHTCDILIEEEAQGIKDSIHNSVLMPFLASKKTKGQIIKIGTANVRNHFYKSCYEDENYVTIRVTWPEVVRAGQYSQEFIDEQRANMTDIEFNAEYNAQFIDDVNAYFPIKLIESCMIEYDLIDIV